MTNLSKKKELEFKLKQVKNVFSEDYKDLRFKVYFDTNDKTMNSILVEGSFINTNGVMYAFVYPINSLIPFISKVAQDLREEYINDYEKKIIK